MQKSKRLKLMEIHNTRTGERRYYINGKRVSNHVYSKLWLAARDSDLLIPYAPSVRKGYLFTSSSDIDGVGVADYAKS